MNQHTKTRTNEQTTTQTSTQTNKPTLLKWAKASRPHTMGLSFAVILAGACQVGWHGLHWDILLLSLLSAGGFQLISNFANDYGDFKKGTDSHREEGYRALSAGHFTAEQVRSAIVVLSALSIVCVIALVWRSPVSVSGKWTMFALGVASVLAALAYTLGKRPYGYYALGDVMVFVFFGVVGVVGSYYLQGGALDELGIWAVAIAFGAWSTSVLNINNLRDSEKDQQHGKTTVANLLGKPAAMRYQLGLFAIAVVALGVYALTTKGWGSLPALLSLGFAGLIYRTLQRAETHSDFNRCLAMTVKLTVLLSLPTALVSLS